MRDTRSHFHFYSIAVAAMNKELDSDVVLAFPIEISAFGEGELKGGTEDIEEQGIDNDGKEYTVKVKADSSVEATWLPLGISNRRTPPDVRRGERLMLYRHSDSGKLHWQTMGLDDHLRKLETAIWSWSATQDEGLDSTKPENAYSFEVSTHNRLITLRTVKANGEPFAYTFQFNTKDGGVTLADDVGNMIELDSAETLIRLINESGTFYEANEENILMFAPGSAELKATNNIDILAGKNALVQGNVSAMLRSGGSTLTLTPSGGTLVAPSFDAKKG